MTIPALGAPNAASQLRGYTAAALMVAAATLIGLAMAPRSGHSAVDLLYLPAVLGAAIFAGLGPSLFAATASALAYNFFFTEPRFTFRIENGNDIVTFFVLLGVALVTSQLAASVRRQARAAEAEAARSATIAGLARQLLGCTSEAEVVDTATREIAGIFACNAVLLSGEPEPRPLSGDAAFVRLTPSDIAVAALVLERGERAGRGIDRTVPAEWQFHPVRSGGGTIAAMGLARDDGTFPVQSVHIPLLDSLLDQLALALERSRLEAEAREFASMRGRDQLRTALLSSIGQDLAPPLGAIADGATRLRRGGIYDKALVAEIGSEAGRAQRYLAKLQDITPESDTGPLETGAVSIDLYRRTVSRDGAAVHLTPKEYAVLAELAKQPGRVLTHAHLLRTVWGPAQETQIDYLRVAIRALRQKLESDPANPALIINEPAVGYRLKTG